MNRPSMPFSTRDRVPFGTAAHILAVRPGPGKDGEA
jgi:hypothetical protein